jgi:hypothetical protein
MIGVDVIDRSCSFQLNSKHSFTDYLSRIINTSELDFCDNWQDLDLIWAIKESAYKCYFKKNKQTFLNPKRIRITSIDRNELQFRVEIDEAYFTGRFKLTGDYVYAISTDEEDFANHVELFLLDDFKNTIQIQSEFGIHNAEYLLNPEGFPEAIRKSEAVFAYSRSHHGKYYFSAISLTPYN